MGSPMMVGGLMIEGLRLMVIGMGIVFAFLLVLVVSLRLMSVVARRLAPDGPAASSGPVSAPAADVPDPALVAVIAAAVHRYRRKRGAPRR
jgi:oxaloacetate decarboxylase gamma subunit